MEKRAALRARIEWPTVALIVATYGAWALGTTVVAEASVWAGIALTGLATALFSSLQHEVIHRHPTRHEVVNALLVFPALNPLVPYLRFRDTHLAHHVDERLTDPFDDPESAYMDPAQWARLPRALKGLLLFNNTLLGRVTVGPLVGTVCFIASDARAILAGDGRVALGWALNVPAALPVGLWLWQVAAMPLWAFAAAVYLSMSILKIRTFLEHQAHECVAGRTAIVEDTGPLAFLFLFNNLHFVHHDRPGIPWYRLPSVFRAEREAFLARNGGYAYRSYAEVIGRYLLRRKEPVAHPLMPEPAAAGTKGASAGSAARTGATPA